MLQPPAPTDSMSTTGRASGNVSILASVVQEGEPRTIVEKSALVPPMSNVSRFRWPVVRARATAAATPPAGPPTALSVGRGKRARGEGTPPEGLITEKAPWTGPPGPRRDRTTSGFTTRARAVVG